MISQHMTDQGLETARADFDRCVNERDHATAERVLAENYALVLVQPAPAEMPRQRWLEVLDDYIVHAWSARMLGVSRGYLS